MLIELRELISYYRLRPAGVLHLGAHLGEEAEEYAQNEIREVVWIEGNPDLLDPLRASVEPYGHRVIGALVADRDEEPARLNVMNDDQSSSILPLGTHARHYEDIHVTHTLELVTSTVDSLAAAHGFERLNFMIVDLQGAELQALRGAQRTLGHIDYVYVEVNREELYQGCALDDEIHEFLVRRGFGHVITRWTTAGWGDAFYVRGGVGPLRRLRGEIHFNGRRAPFRHAFGRLRRRNMASSPQSDR